MHKKFQRSYDSLEAIYEFTEKVLASGNVAQSDRFPVHFATEELFTNMVKYNPGNPNEILLDVTTDRNGIQVTLTDYDVDAFDVTTSRAVDVDAPLEQRKVGGLGLHLIQKMVDSLQYDYSERQSTVTFIKGSG
jgi:serine/threonine-protein kinase RsbW/sigma-B regulation protein RsbU (phosphoserine phosphatase)